MIWDKKELGYQSSGVSWDNKGGKGRKPSSGVSWDKKGLSEELEGVVFNAVSTRTNSCFLGKI